jgi:hypothetical protein
MDWKFYPKVLKAIKSRVPEIHLHAFFARRNMVWLKAFWHEL